MDAPEVEAGNRAGGVGVGTWLTRAEFKDMKVTCDGKTLFAADFSNGDTGWRKHGGRWSVAEGAFKQEGTGENIRAFVGESTWSNYTYSLKARKLGGDILISALLGVQVHNHHLDRFQRAIDQGQLLLIVDVPRHEEVAVRELIRRHHPQVRIDAQDRPPAPAGGV